MGIDPFGASIGQSHAWYTPRTTLAAELDAGYSRPPAPPAPAHQAPGLSSMPVLHPPPAPPPGMAHHPVPGATRRYLPPAPEQLWPHGMGENGDAETSDRTYRYE